MMAQLLQKFPAICGTQWCPWEPAAGPCPQSNESVHSYIQYFCKIHYNIIFPSTPRSLNGSLPFRFFDQMFVRISVPSNMCYMTHQFYPPLFAHPNDISWIKQIVEILFTQLSPASHYSLSLGSNSSPRRYEPISADKTCLWKEIIFSLISE